WAARVCRPDRPRGPPDPAAGAHSFHRPGSGGLPPRRIRLAVPAPAVLRILRCRAVRAAGGRWSLPGGQAIPAAPARAVPVRVPAGGLRVVAVDQHRLHFLDQAGLHGEELADDAIERRHRGGIHRAIDLAEAQDHQHDAALLVDHRVTAVPQVAADETAALEALGGGDVLAIAVRAGE